MAVRVPAGSSSMRMEMCAKLTVPTAAYTKPMASRNTIDDSMLTIT